MQKQILVAYYSHSDNTRKVAEMIQKLTGGDLKEIIPLKPYPRSYNTVVKQAKDEIARGYKPAITTTIDKVYDEVYLGTPNWWGTLAPPVATFLEHDSFPVIHPFCTNGGGGCGTIVEDIKRLAPKAKVTSCLSVFGGGDERTEKETEAWLESKGDNQ